MGVRHKTVRRPPCACPRRSCVREIVPGRKTFRAGAAIRAVFLVSGPPLYLRETWAWVSGTVSFLFSPQVGLFRGLADETAPARPPSGADVEMCVVVAVARPPRGLLAGLRREKE